MLFEEPNFCGNRKKTEPIGLEIPNAEAYSTVGVVPDS
jgi:hypothetical protein